jgi:hypothetical protein
MSPDGPTRPPPEEKLLRLIRGKAAKPPPQPDAAPDAADGVEAVVFSPEVRRDRARPAWSQVAMAVLGAILGMELLWLAWQAAWPLPPVEALPAGAPEGAAAVPPPAPDAAAAAMPELPSLAAIARDALFAASSGGAAAGFVPPSGSATLLASRLTLMGIVAGDPAQAIIEDAQTQKTYFVTAGQAVVEGAVLDQVLDNRVVLDLGGEKIELTL